ncbi:TPA: AAA family ATPase, partial [Escherichia coli]
MRVKVNNFGTISQADVSIGGLTVITGENDTGKSTIGKILFSMVKAISRYEEDLEEDKEVQVTSLV